MTSQAMPMEMRMPVRMVGAAAGRMTKSTLRKVPTSRVRATLSHSRLTEATPKAVFISIGQIEQMKMTDRKSTRLNSSHQIISYAVFCLKKKKKEQKQTQRQQRPHRPYSLEP